VHGWGVGGGNYEGGFLQTYVARCKNVKMKIVYVTHLRQDGRREAA